MVLIYINFFISLIERTCSKCATPEIIIQFTSYLIEFGLCLNPNQEIQIMVLEQKKLGAKDLFKGVLDWSRATTCILILYNDETTYQIAYKNGKLIIKNRA